MNEAIIRNIERLRQFRDDHIKMGKYVLSTHNGDLYAIDLFAVATLNRSMCLLKGFCDLLESGNFVAAAPLIRLQLDNCLRFSAGWLVSEPHEFAMQVLGGSKIQYLTDARGIKMTDRYLVGKLAEEDPRLLTLYKETSGYVHLSSKHIFNSIRAADEGGHLDMKITDTDAFLPDEIYEEAISAFATVTDKLLQFMYGWGYTKDNPEVTRQKPGE